MTKLPVREAARRFEVPKRVLRRRLNSIPDRATARPNCHKLTQLEENTLEKWVLSMDAPVSASRFIRPAVPKVPHNLLTVALSD
jgi:hypothetical protein